ncbi:glycine cleavage system protein GcvH [Actinomadura craniellae]|uniref:Glycine cleavage system H protein n=1 Tax=Actinomadura craniellae TaxID=2231787 RepID=A0A365HCP2_9ACTN|nr:glycine cleavage system protein GcvH [Actinomadura craniellae]RAY16782.1 glycine cleavage system protein GcvH [Actinomadura craniellae]
MPVPANLRYTAEHEWVDLSGDTATVGITAYAADALGDVVYLELPAVGSVIAAGTGCGEIESTKSVSELFAPVDGEVVEFNQQAVDDPGLLNTDPFGAGWLFRVRLTGPADLLGADEYAALTGGA